MQQFLEEVFKDKRISKIEPLAAAGSDRKYFRLFVEGQTFILCENHNRKENECFLFLSGFFASHEISVPNIIAVNKEQSMYVQDDLGPTSLLDKVLTDGYTGQVFDLYKQSLQALVSIQTSGKQLDLTTCNAYPHFDHKAMLADLNYFKYYFLDVHKVTYDKMKLLNEFENLSSEIQKNAEPYFMYRDFQGRNIMIKDDRPWFIDFQGAMYGPLQYDVASLLWQAKANLSKEWKHQLYNYYKQALRKEISFDENNFDKQYAYLVLLRLLQVLGAYGLRGLIEKRSHFLSSIPQGLQNLVEWKEQFNVDTYPELNLIMQKLISDVIPLYQTQQNMTYKATSPLTILIQSFSYKKGIPNDMSGNGGGFVFDCRGILNPGRFDEYKKLTGRDEAVITFLESKTRVKEFLNHAQQLAGISIRDYIERGFANLMISFGCTGGQHRSVYCADQMAKYIEANYPARVLVHHIEQEAKAWVNG